MKNKNNIILISIAVVLVGILIYVINQNNKNNQIEETPKNTYKYNLVNDYSNFFTIETCANKYYNYLSLNDINSLNKIYDKNYQNTSNNYIGKNVNIRVNEMYVANNTYYLKGFIYEELKNGVNKLNEEYLIVKVDKDFKLFSILPITEKEYKEAINEKE